MKIEELGAHVEAQETIVDKNAVQAVAQDLVH